MTTFPTSGVFLFLSFSPPLSQQRASDLIGREACDHQSFSNLVPCPLHVAVMAVAITG